MMAAAFRHLFAGVRLGGAEAAAAPTGTGGLRVVDVKAAAHQVVDVIDVGAIDVKHAGAIDHDAQTMLLPDIVILAQVVIEGHAVLHPAAAAALDKDAVL